jgi:hypothetical protein
MSGGCPSREDAPAKRGGRSGAEGAKRPKNGFETLRRGMNPFFRKAYLLQNGEGRSMIDMID